MASLSTKVFKTKRASRWANFIVSVDATSVFQLLDSVEEAVSPVGLHYFLMEYVSPYFEDQIVDHFAELGGGGIPGGAWPPLEESTLRIRHSLGYFDDMAINERSSAMLHWLMQSRRWELDTMGAAMRIPGDDGDWSLLRKLQTAQHGYTQGSDEMLPGAYTPPRPVLGLTTEDELSIHRMLTIHVANWVANGFLSAGTLP